MRPVGALGVTGIQRLPFHDVPEVQVTTGDTELISCIVASYGLPFISSQKDTVFPAKPYHIASGNPEEDASVEIKPLFLYTRGCNGLEKVQETTETQLFENAGTSHGVAFAMTLGEESLLALQYASSTPTEFLQYQFDELPIDGNGGIPESPYAVEQYEPLYPSDSDEYVVAAVPQVPPTTGQAGVAEHVLDPADPAQYPLPPIHSSV